MTVVVPNFEDVDLFLKKKRMYKFCVFFVLQRFCKLCINMIVFDKEVVERGSEFRHI